MRPRFLRRREGIQLSYDFPHRIYSTCVYPRQSINGSSIVICGHESGLTLVWYGGRKIKTSLHNSDINGDAVDLTQDDAKGLTGEPEYEEEEQEPENSRPSGDIIAQLEVPFGTGASRISVPPLPTGRTITGFSPICESHIVIAAACLDQALRIVAIPIQPVHDQSDVQVIKLATASMHQDLISDVAITWTADSTEEDEAENRARPRSKSRVTDSGQESGSPARKWSILIASASPTGNGLLLVHQLPLDGVSISTDLEDHFPIYRRFIRSPLTGCRLAFNPSSYPAERHSHLLVAIPDASSVQVYDILPHIGSSKRRRGSITTIDSTSSASRPVRQPAAGARTLITLLPGFTIQNSGEIPRRKRVLDAKWIMQGLAVIVLLEDGEWGVWDLEAIGPAPSSRSNNLVKGQTNISGIQGGALTRFAIRGHVGNTNRVIKRKSTSQNRSSTDSTLAPMTPHTRKERSSGLFKAHENPEAVSIKAEHAKGSISVSSQEPASSSRSKGQDESIILTYGASSTFIPLILSYWKSETSGKGSFDNFGGGKPSILPTSYPSTDDIIATSLLPSSLTSFDGSASTPAYITATTSRLIFLLPAPHGTEIIGNGPSNLPVRLMAAKSSNLDQTLLDSGELDVDGMDRILDNMEGSSTQHGSLSNGYGRKSLGFQLNSNSDADDIDVDTPTAGSSKRSKLIVDKTAADSRRLFT